MKYCETYAALLDLYVDGELSLEEMLEVQAHLDECPACQSYVDDALDMRAAFPDAGETEVPEGFAAGVMAKIQAVPAAPRKKKKTPWVGVLTSLAACCAIVILQQNGPLPGGGNDSASVAYDVAAEETVTECDDATTYATAEESVEEAAMGTTTAESGTYAQNDPMETRMEQAPATEEESAEITADAASAKEADLAADSWVEYDNVVFSCVVYLPQDRVGSVLDGYEGKPYSNANFPEEGVIGTGYALEQAEFERILYDEFDYPHGPMLNQNRTTDLCCIVVTETAE